jgi:RimJ/RimL family protein N-acetyltransferase
MIINSKRFILRPPKKSDLKSFQKNKNNPLIAKNMNTPIYPLSLKQAKKELNEIIKLNKKNNLILAIEINKELVGVISLMNIIPKFKAKIGYWIGKEHRKKGITTEAVKLITNYGFKKYKLKRIYGNVATFNKPSARILKKAGFKLEGILKKNRFKYNKYYDDFRYAKVT